MVSTKGSVILRDQTPIADAADRRCRFDDLGVVRGKNEGRAQFPVHFQHKVDDLIPRTGIQVGRWLVREHQTRLFD